MKIRSWIELGIVVMVIYWLLNILGIGCPIKYLTGISCGGCGMTRAWMHLLRLDLPMAYHYHPLFWVPPMALIGILLRSRIPNKIYNITMWIIIMTFVTVYFIRLFNPYDTVVEIDYFNGAIYKWIKIFMKR